MTLAFSLIYYLRNYLPKGVLVKALIILDPPYAFDDLLILGEPRVLKSVLKPPDASRGKRKTVRFITTPPTTRVYEP